MELTLFVLRGCPHCRRALKFMEELCREEPRYQQVKVRQIDEGEQPALADQYDYYYVPCYFLGREKLHEGSCTKDQIRAVLDRRWRHKTADLLKIIRNCWPPVLKKGLFLLIL